MAEERMPNRRDVLARATVAAAAADRAPGQVRGGRPTFTSGVQSGDVTADSAVVWARADRQAVLAVDVAATETFTAARRVGVVRVDAATDFTASVPVRGLPAGEEVFYRVRLASADDPALVGETSIGRFRTAPGRAGDVSFVWSGDICGQGWGINPDLGGMRIFETMRRLNPDFAICSGDTVYADGPILPTVPLADGSVWRNLVVPEKSKVAETLAEYRGNYRYNLLDANLLAFNREVPWVFQWDDHETLNNWYPGEILDDSRYSEKRVDVLAARSRQAFLEYTPFIPGRADPGGRIYRRISYGPLLDVFVLDMRSFKNPNPDAQEDPAGVAILGRHQSEWLLAGLAASRATWKVVAADLPLGLLVPDNPSGVEAVAQGRPGAPLGREVEIADLLAGLRRHRVRNVVWVTADVHYTAAHHYHPDRAAFTDFDPFWEFVSGPLNAGTFGPNTLDPTFGPEAVFVKAPPAGQSNLPPSAGLQFFGRVHLDPGGGLTVELRDSGGAVLWSTTLAVV